MTRMKRIIRHILVSALSFVCLAAYSKDNESKEVRAAGLTVAGPRM